MKFKLATIALLVSLTGCSSVPRIGIDAEPIKSISSQKLATNFKRQGIKVEWDCIWGTGITEYTCIRTGLKAIEATGYAPSFGNSEAMREQAFKVAHDVALDKMIRFVKQDVSSNRVTTTMSKNIEKAADLRKTRISSNDEVSMNDDEEFRGSNLASRDNQNETVRDLTETVRTSAQGIIRGAVPIDERVVDRQTVAVTIRWDKDSDRASKSLFKRFQ